MSRLSRLAAATLVALSICLALAAPPPGRADKPPIGVNMASVTDYSIAQPFAATMKTSRDWMVCVGGWQSQGTLTAHLSDGSAPDYVAAASSGAFSFDRVDVLAYNAASAGKTLKITWKDTDDDNGNNRNVTLQAVLMP